MVVVEKLSKSFGFFQAVHELSFSLPKGGILGFIGPNGAGKTTTMRMLTGYIPPSNGTVSVAGYSVFEESMKVRRIVGYLPETPPLYRELTIGAYLDFVASIRDVENPKVRIGEVMDEVGLSGWENRIIGSLSKGYRQRVGLAQAIIHKPELLILDEPTSGLDPAQVVGIRSFIQRLAASRTVILSTHILSEVEHLCDRVLVINQGKCAAQGDLKEIKKRAGGERYRIELQGESKRYIESLSKISDVESLNLLREDERGCSIEIFVERDIRSELSTLCAQQTWPLLSLSLYSPSLEEAFLSIVGAEK